MTWSKRNKILLLPPINSEDLVYKLRCLWWDGIPPSDDVPILSLSPGKTRKMVASRGGTTVGQNTWVQDLHCKHIDPLSIKRRICQSYGVAFTILSKGCVACYNHKHVVEKEKARLQYTLMRENNSYTFTDQVIGPVPPWAWGIVLTCRIPCQAAGSGFWYTPDRLTSSYIVKRPLSRTFGVMFPLHDASSVHLPDPRSRDDWTLGPSHILY